VKRPEHTSNVNDIRLIEKYLKAHRKPVWVVHTPPESRLLGGFACELIDSSGNRMWKVKIANGDILTVDRREISMQIGEW